jgi:hypothetical protein
MRSSTKRRWLNLHEVSRAPAGSASSATTEVARFRIPEEFLEERVGHSCSPGLGKALPMKSAHSLVDNLANCYRRDGRRPLADVCTRISRRLPVPREVTVLRLASTTGLPV